MWIFETYPEWRSSDNAKIDTDNTEISVYEIPIKTNHMYIRVETNHGIDKNSGTKN